MSEKISSLADAVITTLKRRKKVELQELIIDIGGDAKDVQSVVAILEEEGLAEIKYNLTKIYVEWIGGDGSASQHADKDSYEMLSIRKGGGAFEFKQSQPQPNQPKGDAHSAKEKVPAHSTAAQAAQPKANLGAQGKLDRSDIQDDEYDDSDDYDNDSSKRSPVKKVQPKVVVGKETVSADEDSDNDEDEDIEDSDAKYVSERRELAQLSHDLSEMTAAKKAGKPQTKKLSENGDSVDLSKYNAMDPSSTSKDKATKKEVKPVESTPKKAAAGTAPNSDGHSLFGLEHHDGLSANGTENHSGSILDRNIIVIAVIGIVFVALVASMAAGFSPFAAFGSLFSQNSKVAKTTTDAVITSSGVQQSQLNGVNKADTTEITAPRLSAEVQLKVSDKGYAPSTIEVQKGTELQIVLTNEGSNAHAFKLNEYNISVVVKPHEKKSVSFIAGEEGTFVFYSNMSYYEPAFQIPLTDEIVGKLIVN
jgi:plastocyanin